MSRVRVEKNQQNNFEWCQFKSFQLPKHHDYDILTIEALNARSNVLHFDGKRFEDDKQNLCHDIVRSYAISKVN